MKLSFARHTKSVKAFTLVETLVSTMIITLVILGPLTVASNASTYARITKDTLIATYLGQEAVELLRYQQDSVYIRCIQASSSSACVTTGNETYQDAAWRIFKERLGANAQGDTCFGPDTLSFRCAYDYLDMTSNPNIAPTKYYAGNSPCYRLSIETATGLYVCSGAHGSGSGYQLSNFHRWVVINSINTLTTSDQAYHDDLRVLVNVMFKRPNGYAHNVQVIDFFHAR